MLSKWIKKIYYAKGVDVINKTYFQQGDVLLKMRKEMPDEYNEIKSDLLHKGQNHHHRLRGKFKLYANKDGKIYLQCKEAELYHEEHNTIKIPEGIYEKDIVKEYDHWLEESREVID